MSGTALLFTGQGSHRPGMGLGLEQDLAPWEEVTGLPLVRLTTEADEAVLRATDVAQPAIAAVSLALWRRLRLPVQAVAGHSLGEFTALAAGGALSCEDVLRLVALRGRLMAAAPPGGMAAVMGLEIEAVRAALPRGVVVANDNAPGQVVIAGAAQDLEAAAPLLKAAGARRVLPLAVGGAFHSPLMAVAHAPLEHALGQCHFRPLAVPLVTNADARPTRDSAELPQKLTAQLTETVRWRETVETLMSLGIDRFVEIGPAKLLGPMVRRIAPDAQVLGVSTPEEAHEVTA